ncbi:hypothetical protein SAMN05877753_11331 [Bacillus oleivorans]|uniref:Uncharacterized protein n=1 Tax=Bacillus oleivorans TaxID=1448271 RepID=A0A285D6T5_9BACI|nr:hypothetical protein [Bacillus oleivorans]SNX75531.1 hypothetical protein SAMN05877753_11331 [Bacillus oleivorans]
MGNEVHTITVATGRVGRTMRVRSPFIIKKTTTSLPQIPTALHTAELFKKSDEAVNHLKYRKIVKGV